MTRYKFSKWSGLVVILALLVLVCPMPANAAGEEVSIPDATVGSGDIVNLSIYIDGVTDLGSATIWLSYNKTVVTVDSVAAAGDMGAVTSAIFNDDGVTKMTCQKPAGMDGDFVFVQVVLQAATTSADLTCDLDLDVIEFVDTSFNPIAHTVTDGTFNIDATGPTCTIGVDTDPICDSDFIQEVTVTYNEAMSATPIPTIAFVTTTGIWTSNGDGAWTGGTIWTESFTITDADEEVTDVDVTASGAEDALGNTQTPCTAVDAFDVDTENPTVTSTSPADGATAVAADAAVNATFSEAIVVGANIGAVSISPDPGGVSASIAGAILSIAHNDFTGPAYTVTIPAGAVNDACGNPNIAYSWNFTRLMEGDANLSNCVSSADALVIAQYVVGIIETLSADEETCADTTDDGNVTGADALHIAQWVVDHDGTGGVLMKDLWETPADDDMQAPVDCP
jgi:hypothetical protein